MEDKTIYISPNDLEVDSYEFHFTCPYCGSEETATTYSAYFHEEFQCSNCEKMVDVYCDGF